MAVPAEIRAVPRPKNTVVGDSGHDGPKRYAVRERKGVTYIKNGNPQPSNGSVIGHIINMKFVPVQEKAAPTGAQILSYGSSALVYRETDDLLEDLYQVLDAKEAQKIITIACLRVIKPSIPANRYSSVYDMTFLSKYFPNMGLSENVVGDLLRRLGQDAKLRQRFFARRFDRVLKTHKIAIDGTLKQDTSTINSLSAFSHKARVKGCRDISVLYAYNIDTKEPICAQVFPGNSIDAVSYHEFIKTNNITRGLIIADKGFPPSKIADEFKAHKDLHFITPIKLNDKRISQYEMLSPEGIVEGLEKPVTYKKQALPDGKFLYAFRDVRLAGYEDSSYIDRALKKNTFDSVKYSKDQEHMGVIVFESDQDLSAKEIYQYYSQRWVLELVFRYYKSGIGLDKTNVQTDFSVIGSEFINFFASVITCRIVEKMSKAGVLDRASYKTVMSDLYSADRYVEHADDPVEDDEYWVHTGPKARKELVALGLAKGIQKETDQANAKAAKKSTSKTEAKTSTNAEPAKSKVAEKANDKDNKTETTEKQKAKRGRPRTKPAKDPNAPKRPRGRPRTRPVQTGPKRPRGRPRKDGSAPKSSTAQKKDQDLQYKKQ